jgi:hypothetical protein
MRPLLEPLLETKGCQDRPLGVILLNRREAKHHQYPLAHHGLDGPGIPPGLTLGQIVKRAYLLVQRIEVRRLPQLWYGAQGAAQHAHQLALPGTRAHKVRYDDPLSL